MRLTRNIIENLVNCVNEETNSNYVLEKNIGGYQMYLKGEKGKCVDGPFGFTFERRSLSEIHHYLLGLITTIRYYNNLKK